MTTAMHTARAALWIAIAACGSNRDAPPGESPDAGIDADADPGTEPDAAPETGPRISGATTLDGLREIRQGATAELVLTGVRLTGATVVRLGSLPATIGAVTADQIHATVTVPHGFPKQKLAVHVTTPAGSDTLADAISATFYIVTADAAVGGHGTGQSPVPLCDPSLATMAPGDTLALAPGTHRCAAGLALPGGVHVVGAGVAATLLDEFAGFGFTAGSAGDVTTLTGLTIRATGDAITVAGDAAISDASITRCTRGLVVAGGHATASNLAISGCTGAGIELAAAAGASGLTVRNSQIEGAAAAILLGSDHATCDLGTTGDPGHNQLASAGVALRDPRTAPDAGAAAIQAVGTTLNGNAYTGQTITGPAALAPDYEIAASVIQF
jgi:hypothetical protein